MFEKFGVAVCSKYLAAKAKLNKLMRNEDGMETLEAVLLIIVSVLVVGLIINLLTGGDGEDGLITKIFTKIEESVMGLFDS